jgi:hypothetical protein
MATSSRKGKRKVGRPKGVGVKGFVQTMVSLRPDQRDAVLELAESRREPGTERWRPPVSEVIRELLDEALRRRRRSR